MTRDNRYPLFINEKDRIKTVTNKSIQEIQVDNLIAGELVSDDLRIHPDSLLAQAKIAKQAGFNQLAENFIRAAELARVSNDELLLFYNALRPGRSTYYELVSFADKLEQEFKAPYCAAFIREAAQAYKARGLLKES